MLQRVWERVKGSRLARRVAIATDDERILKAAQAFGAEAFLTRPEHASGTDRVAEVAAQLDATIVVNVQGDEPFIDPAAIDQAIEPFLNGSSVVMSTLKTRFEDPAEASNPNVVKVVVNHLGDALYFTRAPIAGAAKHLGLYVYERNFLLGYSGLKRGPLEAAERLEQLRALENGFAIRVVETGHDSLGVDTEEDLARARELCKMRRTDV